MYMKTSPKLVNVVLMLIENSLRRMRLRMIAIIIKAKVCVICRSQRLKQITQTEP